MLQCFMTLPWTVQLILSKPWLIHLSLNNNSTLDHSTHLHVVSDKSIFIVRCGWVNQIKRFDKRSGVKLMLTDVCLQEQLTYLHLLRKRLRTRHNNCTFAKNAPCTFTFRNKNSVWQKWLSNTVSNEIVNSQALTRSHIKRNAEKLRLHFSFQMIKLNRSVKINHFTVLSLYKVLVTKSGLNSPDLTTKK